MSDLAYVTPALLRAELHRIGYVELETEGPSGATWVDPSHDDRPAVLVPREDQHDWRGFEELIASAVERISWAVEMPLGEVVDRIVERGDRFELRMTDDSTIGGRLPVLRAPGVISGFLQILRGGARAEFRGARATYAGVDPDDVTDALEGIDLLAPAVGSFRLLAVSSVETQLPLDQATALPDKSRRALAAALKGLHAASEATDHEIPDDIEQLIPAIDLGVSTTLLSGLENMTAEAPGMAVEFSIHWDPELPAIEVPDEKVVLRPPQLHRVPQLSRQLRHHEPQENRIIMGWVKTATADELAEAGHPTGLVIVEAKVEDRTRTVLIELPAEQFERVRPGVSWLTAKGTLERISGRWHLTNPTEIHVKG